MQEEKKTTENMGIGKACAIFMNIQSNKYNELEKGLAIRMVLDMPTHNGITKAQILDVLDWLWNERYTYGEE